MAFLHDAVGRMRSVAEESRRTDYLAAARRLSGIRGAEHTWQSDSRDDPFWLFDR